MPFSIVNKGQGWFWCSLLEGNELIGPFPSHDEAEKDARATLGAEWLTATPAECLTSGYRVRIFFQTPHECMPPSPSYHPT
jgi:hypothetical protein